MYIPHTLLLSFSQKLLFELNLNSQATAKQYLLMTRSAKKKMLTALPSSSYKTKFYYFDEV